MIMLLGDFRTLASAISAKEVSLNSNMQKRRKVKKLMFIRIHGYITQLKVREE